MALMLTGLSRESARFQSRSAFSGVGFTTGESESIVNHPVRRQIVMGLMLMGNVGIATVVATLMISLIDSHRNEEWIRNLSFLFAGILSLWYVAKSRWVERHLNKVISWALRRFTQMEVRDYVAVLNLQRGYAVTELQIEPRDWLANKTLLELNLPKEGVLVLGIQRSMKGIYIGAPRAQTDIQVGDTLVLYGPVERLQELDQRRAGRRGDEAHKEAVTEHVEVLEEQDQLEEQAEEASTVEPGSFS